MTSKPDERPDPPSSEGVMLAELERKDRQLMSLLKVIWATASQRESKSLTISALEITQIPYNFMVECWNDEGLNMWVRATRGSNEIKT
jgi:hypothetical protein